MKRSGIIFGVGTFLVIALFGWSIFGHPLFGATGSIQTLVSLLVPTGKIVVNGLDAPKAQGVACEVPHAQDGGMTDEMKVAEDANDAGATCH